MSPSRTSRIRPVRPAVVGALALLVLLAGCGGAVSSGDATTATDTTTTPLPPGVNETGVVPQDLANAHGSSLSGTAYEVNYTTRVTYANGTVYAAISRSGSVAASDHYTATVEQRGAWTPVGVGPRVAYYADGDTTRRLIVGWDGSESVSPPREASAVVVERLGLVDDDRLYQLLVSAESVEVSPAPANDGPTVIRLAGAQPIAPSYVSDPGSANATLRVNADGVVTELTVTYGATVDGERVRVQTTVRYDALGEATVERPEWAETDDG